MKRYFWILAAALVSLAACNKNELQNGAEETPGTPAVTYIRAFGGDDASKASIDNTTAAFTWSVGDTIAVYTSDGYKISDRLSSGGTNDATFTFSGANVVTLANREDFAFYPASLVHGSIDGIKTNCANHHDASNLVVRLRNSYRLNEVIDDFAPTPMIAVNTPDEDLSFKALCPLIRFTVNNIPKQTHTIDFKFNDQNVWGEFTLTSVSPGTSGITKAAGDPDEAAFVLQTKGSAPVNEVITVTNLDLYGWYNQLVINIPVPVGNYGKITVTARDNSGKAILSQTVWPNGASEWVGTRKASKKLTVSLPVFTMDGARRGIFAPGNLQYLSTGWHFAAGQFVVLRNAQADNNRDLFGWGTGGDPNKVSETIGDYDTFNDWGANVIDGYAADTWRTPTAADWAAVFNSRVQANRFVQARYNDGESNINGVVLFPDGYVKPVGLSSAMADFPVDVNGTTANAFSKNIISAADWIILESVGCVFLPSGYIRTGETISNSNAGAYWSSTSSTEKQARSVFFGISDFGWGIVSADNKREGYSVRLVRELD